MEGVSLDDTSTHKERKPMTIKHTISKTDATFYLVTEYTAESHSLTRLIDSKVYAVYLKPEQQSIGELARLSKMDDSTFKDLADIQKRRRAKNDTQAIQGD